jgi:P-type Cu2+ transporter
MQLSAAELVRADRTTVVLHVGDQYCVSEKAVVEAGLGRHPGVLAVDANPVAQTATVTYDPSVTSVADLQRAVEQCGFACAGCSVPGCLYSTVVTAGLSGQVFYDAGAMLATFVLLAQADVGIAIGTGTDVAVETADVVLMRSDPLDVATAITISRGTRRKMHQNLGWAIGYNSIALPIAGGILQPIGFTLSPAIGALSMSGSSIIVAVNAVALKRLPLPRGGG